MSYEKINFKNREVEKPLTFKKHINDDGTITLEPKPGTIVEEGTPLLADHFNHMDDGIYKAHEEIDNLKLSGIERNKELVANLNSKKVSATTNDSLKTNIAKVKDIKLGSGNAVTSDVLQGKTFSSSQGTDLTGTMANNGVLSKTITTQGGTQKISPGYYEGGEVKAQFNNLTPENIKYGVNVGGVVGNLMAVGIYANATGETDYEVKFDEIWTQWSEKYSKEFVMPNISGITKFYYKFELRNSSDDDDKGSNRAVGTIYKNDTVFLRKTNSYNGFRWDVYTGMMDIKPGDKVKLSIRNAGSDNSSVNCKMSLFYVFKTVLPKPELPEVIYKE